MMTFLKFLVFLVALTALAAAGVVLYQRHYATPPLPLRTAAIKRGDVVVSISATGTVEPEELVDVGAQVAGQILSFGKDKNGKTVDYGSEVEVGTVLSKIDDVLYQSAVAVAQAQLAQAQAGVVHAQADLQQMKAKLKQAENDWARAQKLGPSEAMSQTDYDAAEADYEVAKANVALDEAAIVQAERSVDQAKANLDSAKQNLGYCTITSPVKGVVIDRRVNAGQTVVSSLNTPSLFLIAKDLTRMQVWVSVNEADIGQIHPGQTATFTVDAFPGKTFQGMVNKIRLNATMTSNVVTYTVEVTTDNSKGDLLPYLTANVQFEVERHTDVLLVPNAALKWTPETVRVAPDVRAAAATQPAEADEQTEKPHHSPNKTKAGKGPRLGRGVVWVQDGNFVRPIVVSIGLTDGINTEVPGDGVNEGTEVVIGEEHPETNDGGTTNPFSFQMPRAPAAEAAGRPGAPLTNAGLAMELIELQDIYKTYHLGEIDVPVLKGITLKVGRGELVALMGASGSGKTTLMNLLGCLDRATSGEYRLDGQEVSRLSSSGRAMVRNRKIGFVFQSFNLLPRTSALENVMMPLSYSHTHVSEREGRKRAEELLGRVGLGDRLHHEPSQLSGGQQQRVAIARALINRPSLLFADEPTGNLDSRTSVEVLAMFQKLNAEEDITIILVTHDASVAHHAKRIVHIKDGLIESDESSHPQVAPGRVAAGGVA